jgi:hypothetical protein
MAGRWDDTRQLWVTDGGNGGRTEKVIVIGAQWSLEESKTIKGTATKGDETI